MVYVCLCVYSWGNELILGASTSSCSTAARTNATAAEVFASSLAGAADGYGSYVSSITLSPGAAAPPPAPPTTPPAAAAPGVSRTLTLVCVSAPLDSGQVLMGGAVYVYKVTTVQDLRSPGSILPYVCVSVIVGCV